MFYKLVFAVLACLLLVNCQSLPKSLTVMTHSSFAISEELITAFEQEHGVMVELLLVGDAGAALNQAILAKDAPLADVFYGVDNSFMGRALSAGIFEPYQSPALAHVPPTLQLDPSYQLTPIDYGDVCLNYDLAWFAEKGLTPPQTLAELTQPDYKGLLVVENPATSSPGLAFLLATIVTFGEDGFAPFWQALRQNDLLVTSGWDQAYYEHFSAAGEGDRPIVVSYASSPPAEVYFGELENATTASVVANNSCFRQVEFAGILHGTSNRDLAEKWIDYMLSLPFQENIPLNMFVFPANEQATLPEVFVQWAQMPAQPATLPPDQIDANRDQWIQTWTQTVLR